MMKKGNYLGKGMGSYWGAKFSLLLISLISLSYSQIWRPPVRISTDTMAGIINQHQFPYLVAKDSSLWVGWLGTWNESVDPSVLFTAFYDGNGWSRPIIAAQGGGDSLLGIPCMEITENGTPCILFHIWNRIYSVRVYWSWYDGERWTEPKRITRTPHSPFTDESGYDWVSLPNGGIWAIWTGYNGGYLSTAAAHYNGTRWEDPMEIDSCGIEEDVGYATITYGRDGRIWALWQRDRTTLASVYDTVWSNPETVFSSREPIELRAPGLCCDSAGSIWAAEVLPEGAGIIVAKNDGSGWRDHQIISEPGTCPVFPDMVADSSGRVWVVWSDGQIRARYYERGRWSIITTVCPDTWWNNGCPTIAATNREIWVLWGRYDPATHTSHIYGSYTPLSEIGIEEEEEVEIEKVPSVFAKEEISLPANSLITIYDSRGNRVKTFQTINRQRKEELKGLRSGVYFLRLKSNNYDEIKKVILLR